MTVKFVKGPLGTGIVKNGKSVGLIRKTRDGWLLSCPGHRPGAGKFPRGSYVKPTEDEARTVAASVLCTTWSHP